MTVQNISDLLEAGPAELLERSLEEYAELVQRATELTTEHLQALDYALRHSVVRLLVRAAGQEELEAAYDALRCLVPVRLEEELGAWVPRWRAFAALLDTRLASLDAQEPETALRFAHADRILALVEAQPGLTQADISAELTLKPANLSRVLGLLEAHELIERRSVGREKRVFPGRLAPRPSVSEALPAPVERAGNVLPFARELGPIPPGRDLFRQPQPLTAAS